jgi:hypothetical protein
MWRSSFRRDLRPFAEQHRRFSTMAINAVRRMLDRTWIEMLGHLVLADDGADPEVDLGFFAQRLPSAANGVLDGGEVAFGRDEHEVELTCRRRGRIVSD